MIVDIECPGCGRMKDIYISGSEIRAGTRCSNCGEAWEIDLAQFR